jgi:ABC-type methionine transport system ATPase subunit
MLKYPEDRIKEPVLFEMAKRFDVMPNIRRARVTETVGEIVAELDGTPEALEQGIRFLEERGVLVEPLEGDVVSP